MKIQLALLWLLFTTVTVAQSTEEQAMPREDNIGYAARMEGEYLYVTLNTEDHSIMRSMLRRGFYVYFDTKGKKKKNVHVNYPRATEEGVRAEKPNKEYRGQRGQGGQGRPGQEGEQEEGVEKRRPDFTGMIAKLPREATYQYFDTTSDFNLDINNLDIDIAYSYNSEVDMLQYELKIPKHKIAEEGTDFSKLSIGIVAIKNDKEREKPNVSLGGGGRGNGAGGQRGGGQRGGSARQGGGQGRSANGGRQQQQQNQKTDSFDFWFKLEPKK